METAARQATKLEEQDLALNQQLIRLGSALEALRCIADTPPDGIESVERDHRWWRRLVIDMRRQARDASAVETPSPKERTDFQKFVDDEMPGLVAEFQKRQSE
jgi:hypothetical protein